MQSTVHVHVDVHIENIQSVNVQHNWTDSKGETCCRTSSVEHSNVEYRNKNAGTLKNEVSLLREEYFTSSGISLPH